MKKAALILLIVVAVVNLCLAFLYLGVRRALDPPMPGADVPSYDRPEATEPTESTITVPVSLPLQTLEDWANREAPLVFSGSRRWRRRVLVELWDITGVLRAERGSITFAEDRGFLTINTPFTGTLRFTNIQLLNRARPDFDEVDIEGRLIGAANLTMTPDWRMRPEVEARILLNDALVFGIINIRNDLAPVLQEELDRELEKLERELANDDSLERAARQLWRELCGTTLIGEDPQLFLETIPTGIRWMPPRVVGRNVQLEAGLIANTRITEVETTPTCRFPDEPVLDDAGPRGSSVHLPITVRYETVGELFSDAVVGRYFGDSIVVTMQQLVVRPGDDEPVLEMGLHVRAPGAEGTVQVVARSRLNPARQTLELRSFEIEMESGSAVFTIFGWLAEPFLKLVLMDGMSMDLAPLLADAGATAMDGLGRLSTDDYQITGNVHRVRVLEMAAAPEDLTITIAAEGELTPIPWDPQSEQ